MSAHHQTMLLRISLFRICADGIAVSSKDANTLRRAQMTLHRWHELECGDGDSYGAWAIDRDDTETGDGLPYMVHQSWRDGGKTITTRTRIPDREAGAIRRVQEVCDRLGLYFYVQSDPRGCSLYVSNEPLTDTNYTNGVACCV